ncbi:MAG: hypothetical protein AB7J13_01465 [Pyrinomonadaceae bacterium]
MTKANRNQRTHRGRYIRLVLSSLFLVAGFFALPSAVAAQDDPPVPPPIKLISRVERDQLDRKIKDIKDRTKLTLKLMEARLAAAEKLAGEGSFDAMYFELGVFEGLLDDGLEFLNLRDNGKSGKVLDNFKRLEIGLRGFLSRIEVIRRDIPLRYDDYVLKLAKYVRDARTKATEPLFGNTVVPTRKPGDLL